MALFARNKNYLDKYKLGLALSGGGTRGIAHIGAFKAFEQNGIKFSYVAGTSVGSIMGALYCAGVPWQTMLDEARLLSRKDLIDKRFVFGSHSANIEKMAQKLLGNMSFDELKTPFSAVAVDISSGEEVVLKSGEVAEAVSASSAVPMLFTPVKKDGKTLVDGGLLNNLPADVCRQMGAEIVFSVDLNHTRGGGTESTRFWDILLATWNITTKSTVYKGELNSDILITPQLSAFKNTRFDNIDAMFEEGYRAAMEKMPDILELLQTKF